MAKIRVDGVELDMPDEDDWELGEAAEIAKLSMEYGHEAAALIGSVWVAKRRVDPSFTIDDAKRVKLGKVQGVDEPDPLPESAPPVSETGGGSISGSSVSEAEPSGRPLSSVSTG